MFRKSLAIWMLLVAWLTAAELKVAGQVQRDDFVTVESDKTGKWVVIGPATITVKQTTTVASTTIGTTSINFRRTIVQDGGKKCSFVGSPGPYAVIQFVAEEEQPSHLVVNIPGSAPDPDPPGPDPPESEPTTGLRRIVIVYETASRNPSQSQLIKLRSYKGHPLLIVDKDTDSRILKPIIAAVDSVPSVVCLGDDDKVLGVHSLPKTYEDFLKVIEKHK